jgi:hypothetical protein
MAKTNSKPPPAAMILGVGSFAHSIGKALADVGADVSTYLTRLSAKLFRRTPSRIPCR